MKIHRLLLDLFLPRTCLVCGKTLNYHERHLCLQCYADLPLTYFWKMKDHPAERVFWGRLPVERVYCLYYYTDAYRRPLHRLKYGGNTQAGTSLGRMLGEKIAAAVADGDPAPDYIVPVPLHWLKRCRRGYNQSEIIAKGIISGFPRAEGSPAPPRLLPRLLRRRRFTRTQTRKDRISRWENVRQAFGPNPRCRHRPPEGSRILLIDDVLTTGATLEACGTILREDYGCKVSIATIAYVE